MKVKLIVIFLMNYIEFFFIILVGMNILVIYVFGYSIMKYSVNF